MVFSVIEEMVFEGPFMQSPLGAGDGLGADGCAEDEDVMVEARCREEKGQLQKIESCQEGG